MEYKSASIIIDKDIQWQRHNPLSSYNNREFYATNKIYKYMKIHFTDLWGKI